YRKKRSGPAAANTDRPGDPYGRLIDVLSRNKVVLLLDDMQHPKNQDLPVMARAFKHSSGPYRVLAATRGELELSAMDLMLLHHERVGPLNAKEVEQIVKASKPKADVANAILADAARHGCVC